jgi:hypothetical protein
MSKTYKTVATISWRFNSDLSLEEAKNYSRERLADILEENPVGEDYDKFNVQLELVELKQKNVPKKIAEYPYEEILPHINGEKGKKQFIVGDKEYTVRLNGDRFSLFKKSNVCVSCGIVGTKFILMACSAAHVGHMDLYGEEDGRLVLMTKDHIIPRSKNGTNEDSNYQCLCAICNNLKSHYFLTAEDIRKLRELSKNKDKLTPKELRKLINFTRWQLQKNNGEGDTIY